MSPYFRGQPFIIHLNFGCNVQVFLSSRCIK